MSAKESLKKSIKTEDTKKSEEKENSISQPQSINSAFYIKTTQNLSDLEKIREGLQDNVKYNTDVVDKFDSAFENLKEEENEIQRLFENEDNMNKKLEKQNDTFKLDGDLFEVHMRDILCQVYNLKEDLLYPYFSVEPSQKKKIKYDQNLLL